MGSLAVGATATLMLSATVATVATGAAGKTILATATTVGSNLTDPQAPNGESTVTYTVTFTNLDEPHRLLHKAVAGE